MAGSDQQDVPFPDGQRLRALGRLELVPKDTLSGLEPGHAAEAGNVEQDAPADQPVLQDLDRMSCRAARRDGIRRHSVVQRSFVGDVGKGVDVGVGVVVVIDSHVVLGEAERLGSAPRGHVVIRWMGVVRALDGVQRMAQRDRDPLADEPCGSGDSLGRDVVQRAANVVVAPSPPGAHGSKERVELLGADVDSVGRSVHVPGSIRPTGAAAIVLPG